MFLFDMEQERHRHQWLKDAKGDVAFENVTSVIREENPALKMWSFTHSVRQNVWRWSAPRPGKSTIANLITRFYEVESGHIMRSTATISA